MVQLKMNKEQLIQWITQRYSAEEEHPWVRYPEYTVFRHPVSRKWFALLMDIPRCRLGLPDDTPVPVLNVKCGALLAGALRSEPGVFPAYHMNKTHWITIALDGSLADEKLLWLLDLSYEAAMPKKKRK